MRNAIIVINSELSMKDNIFLWLKNDLYKIILMGILPESTDMKCIKEERSCWQDLFSLREKFEKAGFSVSIATEKGSVFNLINTVQAIEADVLFLPKVKFITLATDEFDDFLTQLSCSLVLY